MDGVVIIVSKLEDLEENQVIQWSQPLKPENLGSLPIFEVAYPQQLQLLAKLYEFNSAIICNPMLIDFLFPDIIPERIYYTTFIIYLNGVELRVLPCPSPSEVDWAQLEPALDRLEEVL